MRILTCLLVAATLIAATSVEAAVRWHEDFGRAQQISAQTGRPLLLHFWKHGCPPCVRMEQSVFPHPDVERAIQAGYIPVKINANQSPDLARRFNVQYLPTDVVVSPSGQVLARNGFPKSPAAYVAQLQEISRTAGRLQPQQLASRNTRSDRWSTTSNTARHDSSAGRSSTSQPTHVSTGYQQPYGQQPYGQQPYGQQSQPSGSYQAGSDSRNNAAQWNGNTGNGGQGYSAQNRPTYSAYPAEQQRPVTGGATSASNQNTSAYNQSARPGGYGASQPSGGSFAPRSPYDQIRQQQPPQVARPSINAPQQQAPLGNPAWNQQQPAPTWNGGSRGVNPPQFSQPKRPYGSVPPGGQSVQPNFTGGRPSYADQRQSQTYGQQPSRGGSFNNGLGGASRPQRDLSKFALEGNCPVTLQEQQTLHPSQRRWTPGDERWGARHEGRVYLFAGPEEQRKFLANPNRYAPVLQGNDPVLALDRQQMIPGQRRHGVYYEGRIYLFANESTLKHFSTNPRRYDPKELQAVKPPGTVRR